MYEDIENFIQWVQIRSPQARTWRDYQCDLSLFRKIMEDREVNAIHPRDIDDFIHFQVSRGYKPSTVNRRLAAVASLYTFLNRNGSQVVCPVLAKRHYLREPQRLPRPVNEQDLRTFFGAIQDVRDRAMFTLMLRCGLRIGEVSDLKTGDLFLGESPSRMIIHGKGSQERTVYLSPEAERHLQSWLKHRTGSKDEHVFLSYQQRQLSTTSISVRIQRVADSSGVHITAHRLRHTFADNLLSAGTPITSIQKLMGHRFVETTQNYAEANDRQVQADFYKACEKIDGWKLFLEVVSSHGSDHDLVWEEPLPAEENRHPPQVDPPPQFLSLPVELVQQLESHRQLKANRWREERVTANSKLYYSLHGILWRFFLENCKVGGVMDLRLEHVMQFIKARLDAGMCAKTVNHGLSALRSFLCFLREDDLILHPSLENIQRLKEPEHLPRYITASQLLKVQEAIESNVRLSKPEEQLEALLTRAAFYLMWQGGLRTGEVELLHFSDFYISAANQAKRLFIRDGKWRKGRAVYLTDMALDALKSYLAVRGSESMGGRVFVRDGVPLKRGFLCRSLQRLARRAGVNVTPHRLRHTFATQLLNVGCRITSIQRLLGHSNLNTTMTYARAFDQTVMLDYFRAVDIMESSPDGVWSGLTEQ